MSDTKPAECTASISGSCLAESQSETACDTEAGECVYGGQPAAVPVPPPADQTALRDRLAEVLTEAYLTAPGDGAIMDVLADAVLAALPEQTDRATLPLTAVERQFLTFALDLASDEMASRGNEFGDEDEAALEKLRRVAAEEQPAETPEVDLQVWPLHRVLTEVRCGSEDWTWEEEWADLDRRHAETGYLDTLEARIRENGITMPVLIGTDGRLWDGHHRLRIAVRLGIGYVPVEITPKATARPAVGEPPDTLPPPEGPEYTPCICDHIEPEHEPDAGACLSCDCEAYRPVLPVDFLTVHLADGGTWTRLDRLTDGRIMCCLCFNYCTRDQLNPCEGGVEDVCKPCAQREAAVMAARADALRNDKEGES